MTRVSWCGVDSDSSRKEKKELQFHEWRLLIQSESHAKEVIEMQRNINNRHRQKPIYEQSQCSLTVHLFWATCGRSLVEWFSVANSHDYLPGIFCGLNSIVSPSSVIKDISFTSRILARSNLIYRSSLNKVSSIHADQAWIWGLPRSNWLPGLKSR